MSTESAPDGTPFLQVGITGRAAGHLADMVSIAQDLNLARRCTRAYAGTEQPEANDDSRDLLRQALWNAGLIAYRRAFTSGRSLIVERASRLSLEDHLVALVDNTGADTHRQAKDLANTHVAHRVDQQEQATVNAILQPPPDRRVVALAPLNAHMLGPTTEFADMVADLCEMFLDVLQQSIDELSDQLLASVEASDLDDLFHRREDRIRAHDQLCWLALLLIRVVETTTGDTWPVMRRHLERLHAGTFSGPDGTFRQRSERSPSPTTTCSASSTSPRRRRCSSSHPQAADQQQLPRLETRPPRGRARIPAGQTP